jgi:hypothetical protein
MVDKDSTMNTNTGRRSLSLAWVFTAVGALNCALVPIMFAISEVALQDGRVLAIWPLPLIYFIEIFFIGILGVIAMANIQKQPNPFWLGILWICSGILLAFVILGAWTIGFFLIPAMILFLLVGVTLNNRSQGNIPLHLIYFVAVGIAQSTLVFLFLYI